MNDRLIKLNENQISEFALRKSLKIDGSRYLELLNDDILININGIGYYPTEINIKYNEQRHERELPVERLQKEICKHFNFEPINVIFEEGYGLEFKFYVKFGVNNIREMIVCDFQTAINITNEIRDFNKVKLIRKNLPQYIGTFRRLNNSCYYFTWLDEID